jgi:hypothetical protein
MTKQRRQKQGTHSSTISATSTGPTEALQHLSSNRSEEIDHHSHSSDNYATTAQFDSIATAAKLIGAVHLDSVGRLS